jgi:hypothetical protein
MTLSAEVTNNGTSSLQLSQFTTSTLTFATSPVLEQGTLTVDSGGEIAAGATSTVAISMTDVRWEEDSLVPSTESQLEIVGLLVFDAAGDTQFVEVHAPLALEF